MKKLLTTLLFSALSLTAQAKYMGMNEIPIQDSETGLLFSNAVKSGNFELVEKLLDTGFSLDYTFKEVCFFTGDLHPSPNTKIPTTEEEYDKLSNYVIGSNSLLQTYFTDCDKLPLLSLHKRFIWDYTDHLNKKNEYKIKDYEKQNNNIKLASYFMDKLSPDQYEQLFVYANGAEMPFELKKKALLKLIESEKNKENINFNEIHKNFMLKVRLKDNNFTNHANYLSINNHMFDTLFESYLKGYLDSTNKYTSLLYGYLSVKDSKRRAHDIDLLSIHQQYPNIINFNIKLLESGSFVIDDNNTFNNDNLKISLIRVKEYLELMDILLKSGLIDLSKQDVNGNTILHLIFYRYDNLLIDNDYSPSLIRFLLESGANPLLLNKDGSSAFNIFQKKTNNKTTYEIAGPIIKRINEAFVQQEFKD